MLCCAAALHEAAALHCSTPAIPALPAKQVRPPGASSAAQPGAQHGCGGQRHGRAGQRANQASGRCWAGPAESCACSSGVGSTNTRCTERPLHLWPRRGAPHCGVCNRGTPTSPTAPMQLGHLPAQGPGRDGGAHRGAGGSGHPPPGFTCREPASAAVRRRLPPCWHSGEGSLSGAAVEAQGGFALPLCSRTSAEMWLCAWTRICNAASGLPRPPPSVARPRSPPSCLQLRAGAGVPGPLGHDW